MASQPQFSHDDLKRQGQQSLPLGYVPGYFPGHMPHSYVANVVRPNVISVAISNRYAAMGFELMTITEDHQGQPMKPPAMIFNGGCDQR